MGGLEKITEHILSDAKAQADENIKKATEQVNTINAQKEADSKKIRESYEQKISNDCEKIMQMAISSDKQNKRQIILKAKSDVIKGIIEDAKNTLKNMDDTKYTDFIKSLLKNSVSDSDGEILFSQADQKLLTDEMKAYIKEISNDKLTISQQTSDIDRGFIIKYGKIELNCSIDSIFEDKYNKLCDIVNEYLSAN